MYAKIISDLFICEKVLYDDIIISIKKQYFFITFIGYQLDSKKRLIKEFVEVDDSDRVVY